MSGKKAKLARKKELKVVGAVMIKIYDNGLVIPEGYPPDLQYALDILAAATKAIALRFARHGMSGELDDKYQIKQSPIIKPPGIVGVGRN